MSSSSPASPWKKGEQAIVGPIIVLFQLPLSSPTPAKYWKNREQNPHQFPEGNGFRGFVDNRVVLPSLSASPVKTC